MPVPDHLYEFAVDLARQGVRGGAKLVAVEGYMDVIALAQAGFGGAGAGTTGSGTSAGSNTPVTRETSRTTRK